MLEGFRPCPFCGGTKLSLLCGDKAREYFEKEVKETGWHCVAVECDCGARMWQYHETDYDVAMEHLTAKWNTRKRGQKNETK